TVAWRIFARPLRAERNCGPSARPALPAPESSRKRRRDRERVMGGSFVRGSTANYDTPEGRRFSIDDRNSAAPSRDVELALAKMQVPFQQTQFLGRSSLPALPEPSRMVDLDLLEGFVHPGEEANPGAMPVRA